MRKPRLLGNDWPPGDDTPDEHMAAGGAASRGDYRGKHTYTDTHRQQYAGETDQSASHDPH